jgi:hypothetical protein
MSPRRLPFLLGVLALAGALGGCFDPDPPGADFVVDVAGEQFVVRATRPLVINEMREAVAGKRKGMPFGPLHAGDGGFNRPWSWHFDEEEVVLAEFAIEICDGRPSLIEANVKNITFPMVYCPWDARIVAER